MLGVVLFVGERSSACRSQVAVQWQVSRLAAVCCWAGSVGVGPEDRSPAPELASAAAAAGACSRLPPSGLPVCCLNHGAGWLVTQGSSTPTLSTSK